MPQRPDQELKYCLIVGGLGIGLGSLLAGCSTSADVSYGEYQFGPGYQTGRMYESRVYGDTQRGFGSENCRTVVRRQVGPLGRPYSAEETVCE